MEATLTELRRDMKRVIRAAESGSPVILTEHGQPRFKLTAIKPIDYKAALAALKAIGPIEIPPRQ